MTDAKHKCTSYGVAVLKPRLSVGCLTRLRLLEQCEDGDVAKAKAAGKYKGRVPTAMRKTDDVLELAAQGATVAEIIEQVGISRTSVWRITKANESRIAQTADPARL
jgi:hypothetical protein